MRFQNKVCLVTGGASGIGRATCVRLGAEGGQVAVLDRDPAGGAETVQQITAAGGQALFVPCDLSDATAIAAAVQQVLTAYTKIDVLVNNAAMMTFDHLVDLPLAKWDVLMSVNLRAFAQLCQLCLPHMQHGAIVAVSSVHAHQTTPNVIPYAASKGAMEAMVRGLSREIPITQARVNAVAPGAVDTPMLWSNPNVKSGLEKIDGPIGKPEELAAAICFLASDEASFVHGTTLAVDGGRLATL